MTEALRFGFLLFATCYAIWRSRRAALLCLFFCSNLIYELATEIPYLLGWHYHAAYMLGTCLWIFFGLWLVWDEMPVLDNRLRVLAIPAVLSIALTRICYLGMARHLTQGEWVIMLEGSVLIFMGQALGTAAAYLRRYQNAYLLLALLWLAQGVFLYGYILHDDWPSWVPALIVGTGFLLVGLAVPQPSRIQTLRERVQR